MIITVIISIELGQINPENEEKKIIQLLQRHYMRIVYPYIITRLHLNNSMKNEIHTVIIEISYILQVLFLSFFF